MNAGRVMTWEEIDKDWSGLQKRHRMEIAQAVARYCIGHKIQEVAEHLGFSVDWTRRQLDYAGIAAATDGGSQLSTPPGKSGDKGVDHAVARLVSEYAPDVKVKISDDGRGNQSVAEVEGDDAEDFKPYLNHYIEQGHEPAAATRLAKAEWAAEAAVEAGVIKESVNKRNEKVNQILFPSDSKDTFEIDLKMHMARVESAARFLDEAKVPHLRRKATCERVAAAHEKWLEQVERVLNFHPTLNKDV
jgi:hypothetical protein